jgi:1-acyl-sn-glycerol-3-phosphate acyltransferase
VSEPRSAILRWREGAGAARWGRDVGDFDAAHLAAVRHAVRPFFGPHGPYRVEVQGWVNVPPTTSIFVSNHGGGTTTIDMWGLLYAWYGELGLGRQLHPLAHELLFASRRLGRFFAGVGVLRAGLEQAEHALRAGHDVLVLPGGDREAWRPWRDRWHLQFAGRRGYARLALRAGVPIVPVASAGAHHTLVVLTDGHKIAKRLPIHQIARADIFPVHLSLPWGLAIGPWPHLPWPTPLRYRVEPAVPFPRGWRAGEPDEEVVAEYDAAVRASLQRGLEALRLRAPEPAPVSRRRAFVRPGRRQAPSNAAAEAS